MAAAQEVRLCAHPDRFEWKCHDCRHFMCDTCKTLHLIDGRNQQHTFESIASLAQRIRTRMQASIASCNKDMSDTENEAKDLKAYYDAILRDRDEALRNINRTRQEFSNALYGAFAEYRETIENETERELDIVKADLASKRSLSENIRITLEQYTGIVDEEKDDYEFVRKADLEDPAMRHDDHTRRRKIERRIGVPEVPLAISYKSELPSLFRRKVKQSMTGTTLDIMTRRSVIKRRFYREESSCRKVGGYVWTALMVALGFGLCRVYTEELWKEIDVVDIGHAIWVEIGAVYNQLVHPRGNTEDMHTQTDPDNINKCQPADSSPHPQVNQQSFEDKSRTQPTMGQPITDDPKEQQVNDDKQHQPEQVHVKGGGSEESDPQNYPKGSGASSGQEPPEQVEENEYTGEERGTINEAKENTETTNMHDMQKEGGEEQGQQSEQDIRKYAESTHSNENQKEEGSANVEQNVKIESKSTQTEQNDRDIQREEDDATQPQHNQGAVTMDTYKTASNGGPVEQKSDSVKDQKPDAKHDDKPVAKEVTVDNEPIEPKNTADDLLNTATFQGHEEERTTGQETYINTEVKEEGIETDTINSTKHITEANHVTSEHNIEDAQEKDDLPSVEASGSSQNDSAVKTHNQTKETNITVSEEDLDSATQKTSIPEIKSDDIEN